MTNELLPTVVWTSAPWKLPTVQEACGKVGGSEVGEGSPEPTEPTTPHASTAPLGEARSLPGKCMCAADPNLNRLWRPWVNRWSQNSFQLNAWAARSQKLPNGKWSGIRDKYWHATGLPCSNTVSQCGKAPPGCRDGPQPRQAPCLQGKPRFESSDLRRQFAVGCHRQAPGSDA